MPTPKKKNKRQKEPTILERKVASILIAKGGKSTVSSAIREAGGSESIARNSQKITRSVGFNKLLERAGISDKMLAEKHSRLLNATTLGREEFNAQVTYEEDPKRKNKKIEKVKHYTTEQIKLSIEGSEENPTGCRILYIKVFSHRKVAVFRVPDNAVQAKNLEMAYKVKGHFAPEKVGVEIHELTEDERRILAGILGNE